LKLTGTNCASFRSGACRQALGGFFRHCPGQNLFPGAEPSHAWDPYGCACC
jgi:hypothetical protein